MDKVASILALMNFKIDSIIELLIQNGTIDKDEFRNLVFQKIDRAENEEAKTKMKETLDKLLEDKIY